MIVASADEINLSIYSFKANIKKKKKNYVNLRLNPECFYNGTEPK